MADNENSNQPQVETINSLDAVFGDVSVPVKAGLAFNGEARSNKEVHDLTINVSLKGVSIKDAIGKALSQRVIDFRSSRRDENSGGVFTSREAFDEYCENLGGEIDLHYNAMGNSPVDPHKAEQEADNAFNSMTPEQQEAWLEEQLAKRKG